VLYRNRLRCSRRGSRDRAICAIVGDALRRNFRHEDNEQRQHKNQSTDNSCKLPIHSEFSKGG
jgi:hypothetical protein